MGRSNHVSFVAPPIAPHHSNYCLNHPAPLPTTHGKIVSYETSL